MPTCKCGESDPRNFDKHRRECKRCHSRKKLERYKAKLRASGREPGPPRITKLQNPKIWKAAKSFGLMPHDYLKALHG